MFVALVLVILGIVFFGLPATQNEPTPPIVTPPVTTSTPPETTPTTTPNDEISTTTSPNLRNLNIQPNGLFTAPYEVTGEAKQWYFEGSFPVKLLDSTGKEIRVGYASAGLDWMSPDFVPFTVTWMTTGEPKTSTGTLVLQKDNPSDLPEHDEEVRIPVSFSAQNIPTSADARVSGGCVITGCSSHICASEETPSDCMYREEYTCYQKAKCERQESGQCGWTLTSDINACLQQYQ